MLYLKITTVIVFSFLLVSCSGGYFNYSDFAQKNGLPSAIEQKDYPEDDGVVILSDTYMDMDISTFGVFTNETVRKAIKLFKNIEEYGSVEISIYDGESMENISARTIKPDGTIIEIKPEEFYEVTGDDDGISFYSDKKSIRFTFPGIEKNCIVEYEYKKLKRYPFMQDSWLIQDKLPVLMNNFTISVPEILMEKKAFGGAEWSWNYMAYNYSIGQPEAQSTSDRKLLYKWSLKNIKPLKEEKYMPSYVNYLALVRFAPGEWLTWSDISKWYYEKLFSPQLVVTDEIKEKALELTKGAINNKEKIKRLYDYVKKIRYVSINLGDGSIRPAEPQKTLERQYGDCKDKSMLLIALLKAVAINANPVLALTSNKGELDPKFPSWNFNHMLVKVKDNITYWMDATSKYSPLGKLPYVCENINALVLNDDGTSIIQVTPSCNINENTEETFLDLKLSPNGESDFEVYIKYRGQMYKSIRYNMEDKTEKEIKDYCKSLISDVFTAPEITSCGISEDDTVCVLKFKGRTGNILQKQSDLYFVSSDPFKFFESTSWLPDDTRQFPLDLEYPHIVKKSISITLPQDFNIRNLPGKLADKTDELYYSKNISHNTNQINVNEEFIVKNKIIKANKYKNTKRFFENIKDKYGEKIILVKG